MESLGHLFSGFSTALEPFNFGVLLLGVILGLVVGVLPGLGAASGIAILLPISVYFDPTTAIIFLASIYWGALIAGVITSILFNIPGETWSVAVLFDGHPLARQGRAGLALTAAFMASFVGKLVAIIILTFVALPLAEVALRFGPPEMFAVLLMAFAAIVGLGGGSPWKAIVAAALGFLLTTVGLDIVTGKPRFTFGTITLLTGFHFIPVTIGLYGIGEILYTSEERVLKLVGIQGRVGLRDIREALQGMRRSLFALVSGTLIGFWTGVLPGTGATVAQFLGYGIARQYSKNKANFGKGAVEGVIAPQAAANAAGIGATLPMVTLGIPGSPTTAVLLAGIWIWGLTPGPRLFTEHPDFVWGFIASMYLANVVALLICLGGVPVLAAIMRVPYGILTPFIVVISLIGAYVINNSFLDIWVALGAGVLGYFMRKLGYPLAALVIALVLGDMTETALRQSLILGDGSPAIFFTRPLAGSLMGVAILLFFYPLLQVGWLRLKRAVTVAQVKEA